MFDKLKTENEETYVKRTLGYKQVLFNSSSKVRMYGVVLPVCSLLLIVAMPAMVLLHCVRSSLEGRRQYQ